MRLALDIGGTLVKCALVSDEGEIAATGSFATHAALETEDFGSHLVQGALKFISESKIKRESITIVGAGMAGFADGKRGIVYESPNLPGVRNLELAKRLSEGIGKPAFAENDATAAAWGEYLFGGHEGIEDMLVVTLGTGIGGGLVLGGRLHRGARGMAGEIGQMAYTPDGPECPGGGMGCLEHYVGKAGLMEDYRIRARLSDAVEPKEIHKRAEAGDRAAMESWEAYGHKLGVVLASSANLLDLGAVILTGGITGAWEEFRNSLARSFRNHLITPHKDRLKVEVSALGGNAGILGAAFLDKV